MKVSQLQNGQLIGFSFGNKGDFRLPYTGVYEGLGLVEAGDTSLPVLLARIDGGDGEIEMFDLSCVVSIRNLND